MWPDFSRAGHGLARDTIEETFRVVNPRCEKIARWSGLSQA
jgi:hypothetical protein